VRIFNNERKKQMDEPEQTPKMYPPWRQAVADVVEAGLTPGAVLRKDWLLQQFGINEPKTIAEAQQHHLQWLQAFSNFRDELLQKHQVMLRNVSGVGYEVIAPGNQTQRALQDRGREVALALKRMTAELTHIDAAALTDEQRKENSDALAKVGALVTMNKSTQLLE